MPPELQAGLRAYAWQIAGTPTEQVLYMERLRLTPQQARVVADVAGERILYLYPPQPPATDGTWGVSLLIPFCPESFDML